MKTKKSNLRTKKQILIYLLCFIVPCSIFLYTVSKTILLVNPAILIVEYADVEMTENQTFFVLRGDVLDSALFYSGYSTKKRNNDLYIKLHYTLVRAISTKSSRFDINIDLTDKAFESIYLFDGDNYIKIYDFN